MAALEDSHKNGPYQCAISFDYILYYYYVNVRVQRDLKLNKVAD